MAMKVLDRQWEARASDTVMTNDQRQQQNYDEKDNYDEHGGYGNIGSNNKERPFDMKQHFGHKEVWARDRMNRMRMQLLGYL